MNITVPNLAATRPPETATHAGADNNTSSAAAPTHNQGFAAAMQSVSAKPVRKGAASKTSDTKKASDGDNLPAGKALPPTVQPSPPPAATDATTAAAAAAASAATAAAATAANVPAAGATNTTTTGSATSTSAVSAASGSAPAGGASTAPAQANAAPAIAADDSEDAAPARAANTFGDNSDTDTDEADTGTEAIAAAALPTSANVAQGAALKATIAKQSPIAASAAKPNGPTNPASTDTTLTAKVASNPPSASATSAASLNLDGSNAADAAALSVTSGAAAQNTAPVSPAATTDLATPQAATPDAATALATAGATASAAVAASAAGIITALAASTAVDEKHVRGTSEINSGAASTAIDGSAGAGAAQAAAGTTSTQSADPAAANLKVSASVDSSEFGQGVANQIASMVDKNISSAKMQVNPPSLGPIEVRISVQGDHAQVWMVSHSAVTRDALQSSTPTLREMLNNQGFGQVSVDISQRSFQERTPTPQTYAWNSDTKSADSSAATGTLGSVPRASNGILDAYA